MVYDVLIKLLRKKFYIVSYERYKSDTYPSYLERFVAKHPLLKPELIVVNDQPYGFKKLKKELLSLEKHPIYCELEYSLDSEGNKFIDHFDLYSEAKLKVKDKLSDIIQLSNIYTKSVTLERVKRVNDPSFQILVVYSKLGEMFMEEFFEQDVEEELISEQEIEAMFESHITGFINFVKILDDIVSKGKSLNNIDNIDSMINRSE